MYASTSPRLAASAICNKSSLRSGVVDSSDISPLLSEAFGGCTGLVDVEVGRLPLDDALRPHHDRRPLLFDVTVATNQATVFPEGRQDDAVAEIDNLLHFDRVLTPR